ncbi:MBL fold metallo-hydrolase [Saccharolobus shibatae]|uniref:MBL-fold metallo-hydrolase superfamily n=1 Tax=Saccharolobus shibatae TaxID=2286 RepID=A0A8F5BT70_9CREN|nr:MBL fold metallo-hydrolase [Saccharolobus shibatae]QXJ31026.1 MBL-fold metallo-hydrolase superfamily [Saccharolobus shibatae]
MSWKILVNGAPIYTSLGFVGFCNVTLIEADDSYLIYDPGHFGNKEVLLGALKDNGLSPLDIDGVILSHMHYDHSLNSLIFPNAKVYITKEEVEYTKNSPDNYSVTYLPDLLRDRIILVKDNEELYGLKFVLLPGHTAGSLGVIYKDTIFVGDAIKYIIDAQKSETSFAYYNITEANKSIRKVLDLASKVVPGHDIPFTIKRDGNKIQIIQNIDLVNKEFIIYTKNNDYKIFIKKSDFS